MVLTCLCQEQTQNGEGKWADGGGSWLRLSPSDKKHPKGELAAGTVPLLGEALPQSPHRLKGTKKKEDWEKRTQA